MLGGSVERPMIVHGVYDKQILDIDGPVSLTNNIRDRVEKMEGE